MLGVIQNVGFLPVLNPIADAENFHLSVCGRADDTIKASIDDHFLADKTGEGVYRLVFSRNAAMDIHVTTQKADSGPGSIDDGILFGMDAPA